MGVVCPGFDFPKGSASLRTQALEKVGAEFRTRLNISTRGYIIISTINKCSRKSRCNLPAEPFDLF